MCAAVAITAGGLFLVASPAAAKRPIVVTGNPDLVVRHVSFADLNLASFAGENTLRHRVRGAVKDVCLEATGGNTGGAPYKINMVNCSASAWDGANPQIAAAVQRAREIAATGSSNIAAAAITISIPQ